VHTILALRKFIVVIRTHSTGKGYEVSSAYLVEAKSETI
jgi:hypothetical protein